MKKICVKRNNDYLSLFTALLQKNLITSSESQYNEQLYLTATVSRETKQLFCQNIDGEIFLLSDLKEYLQGESEKLSELKPFITKDNKTIEPSILKQCINELEDLLLKPDFENAFLAIRQAPAQGVFEYTSHNGFGSYFLGMAVTFNAFIPNEYYPLMPLNLSEAYLQLLATSIIENQNNENTRINDFNLLISIQSLINLNETVALEAWSSYNSLKAKGITVDSIKKEYNRYKHVGLFDASSAEKLSNVAFQSLKYSIIILPFIAINAAAITLMSLSLAPVSLGIGMMCFALLLGVATLLVAVALNEKAQTMSLRLFDKVIPNRPREKAILFQKQSFVEEMNKNEASIFITPENYQRLKRNVNDAMSRIEQNLPDFYEQHFNGKNKVTEIPNVSDSISMVSSAP